MIILITGASHTGKTMLAQRLLETYACSVLSMDHLKMGLIRSGFLSLTPEDDEELRSCLWPIVREMIKTAIENGRNLIVEGIYVPFDWEKDFTGRYRAFIRFYPLVMTEDYIRRHFREIKAYACVMEDRGDDSSFTEERAVEENRFFLEQCRKYGYRPVIADGLGAADVDPEIVTESERLIFRQITEEDYPELCRMLQDPEVMYAWEHAFSEAEVREWIKRRQEGYRRRGYDYFLAVDRESRAVVGQIGLLDETVDGRHMTGVGYMLKKEFWHRGYAAEGARAMLDYGFRVLEETEIIATIRPENRSSLKVARAVGMKETGSFIKVYNGKEMRHLIFCAEREDFRRSAEGEHSREDEKNV